MYIHRIVAEFVLSEKNTSPNKKVELHKVAAKYLEQYDDIESLVEVKYHYIQAGQYDYAVTVALQAAGKAEENWQYKEAKTILLDIVEFDISKGNKISILWELGHYSRNLGEISHSLKFFKDILELIDKSPA